MKFEYDSLKKTLQLKANSTAAVFGGSFNPFHEGHLGIVNALADDPEIDRVLVVPARRSPFKDGPPPLPDEVRWNMLHAGLAGLTGARGMGGGQDVHLLDLEMRRPPPSYTFATLGILSSLYPRTRLQLALGWDAFLEFAQWRCSSEILRMAGLILFDRAGVNPANKNNSEEKSVINSEEESQEGSKALAELLPPPWNAEAVWDADSAGGGQGRLTGRDGQVLLRRVVLPLPQISGREILRSRSLEGVPPGAREVLEAHWRQR